MNVKRFEAGDMASALAMIRNELGPDAVIISSRKRKVTSKFRRRSGEVIEVIAGLPSDAPTPATETALGTLAAATAGPAAEAGAITVDDGIADEAVGSRGTKVAEAARQGRRGAVSLARSAIQAIGGTPTQRETADGAAAMEISAAAHEAAARAALDLARAPSADAVSGNGNDEFTDLQALLQRVSIKEAKATKADGPETRNVAETLAERVQRAAAELAECGTLDDEEGAETETVSTLLSAAPETEIAGVDAITEELERDDAIEDDTLVGGALDEREPAAVGRAEFLTLQDQIAELRELVLDASPERASTELTLPEPARAFIERLRWSGVSESLISRTCEATNSLLDSRAGAEIARRTVEESLLSFLPAKGTPTLEHGKTTVVHVVGPSGSGKTLTAVRLALRLSRSEGHPVVLANADQKRLGAGLQLQAYGEALEIPVVQIYGPSDLKLAVADHRGAVIIVDTPGRIPSSAAEIAEYKALMKVTRRREVFLTLDATAKESDLLASYEAFRELKLSGLVFSKTDASERLGPALSLLSSAETPLLFLSGSDDVLDDLEAAGPATLLERLLRSGLEDTQREYAAS